jgi:hypothetical protein
MLIAVGIIVAVLVVVYSFLNKAVEEPTYIKERS